VSTSGHTLVKPGWWHLVGFTHETGACGISDHGSRINPDEDDARYRRRLVSGVRYTFSPECRPTPVARMYFSVCVFLIMLDIGFRSSLRNYFQTKVACIITKLRPR